MLSLFIEDNVAVQDKGEFSLQCSFIIDDG